MLRLVRVVAIAAVLALAGSAVADAKPRTVRVCGNFEDPTPSQVVGVGTTCKTARSVARLGLAGIQRGRDSFDVRLRGRVWACDTDTGRTVFFCDRGSARVRLRER